MTCLNFTHCSNRLLPHEGHDPRPYYRGYCDDCCAERDRASEEEDAAFDLNAIIDAYVESKLTNA